MLGAVDEALDDHVGALGLGQRERGLDVVFAVQIERHATCVVAVGRLHGDGEADVLGNLPGFFGVGRDLAFGHGHTAGGEQALGEVLVLCNAFGDRAGLVALGGPDAALCGAVAELHEVAVVQTNVRNAAFAGGIDNAAGAGAEVTVVDFGLDGANGGLQIKRLIVDGRHQQLVAIGQSGARHGFFGAAEHHAVHAALRYLARLTKLGGHAGQVEQLDDHMLQHMAHPGAFLQAQQKAAALAYATMVLDQVGQPGAQTFVEAGDLVGRVIFQFPQIQPDLQNGAVGPDAGSAQIGSAQKFDIFEGRHGLQLVIS